jgi:Tol biopolymer transport system component
VLDFGLAKAVEGGSAADGHTNAPTVSVEVTRAGATFVEPRFSPDGRRLAVEVVTGSTSHSWVYDIERGTATRLTFGEGEDSTPVWTADGASIVGSSTRDDGTNLYRRAADGSGEEERLTTGGEVKVATRPPPMGAGCSTQLAATFSH